jgi:hypothetical protein
MSITRNLDAVKTQTFALSYDLQSVPITCNLACTAVAFPAYVSMSATTITVDPALTVATDAGSKTITINCASVEYATVTARNYSFVLQINHCTANTFTLATIGDKTMTVNDGLTLWPFSAAVMNSDNCLYTVSYTATYVLNAATVT